MQNIRTGGGKIKDVPGARKIEIFRTFRAPSQNIRNARYGWRLGIARLVVALLRNGKHTGIIGALAPHGENGVMPPLAIACDQIASDLFSATTLIESADGQNAQYLLLFMTAPAWA